MPVPSDTSSTQQDQEQANSALDNTSPTRILWRLLGNFLAPLRVPDFRLLFSWQMISTLGDMFYAIALPWLMLSSGHTPQELGIVLAAYGVPRVGALLLVGGAAFLMGIAGIINGILTVLAFTLPQQQAPRHLLGRLMGVLMVATLGLYPFSVAIAGIISTRVGPAILFPISGAMMLTAAVFGWLQRDVRALS